MAAKEKRTKVTNRAGKFPGETLLEVSFGVGTANYQGCLISILVQDDGTPVIDVYRADDKDPRARARNQPLEKRNEKVRRFE